MKPEISLTVGRSVMRLATVLALLLTSGMAGAADRLVIPDDMDLPFYLRGLGHNSDLTWVGTVFYRPFDELTPGDIAVNQFVSVDPTQYPLCVEGFVIWKEGDSSPMTMKLWNRPGKVVPICFASAEEYVNSMAGGTTVEELRAMPSLLVGYADFYLEIQQPADRDVPGGGFNRTVIASGVLEDGRPFFVRSVYTAGAYNVEFTFGD